MLERRIIFRLHPIDSSIILLLIQRLVFGIVQNSGVGGSMLIAFASLQQQLIMKKSKQMIIHHLSTSKSTKKGNDYCWV
jgi:hypothetical protein